LKASIIIPTYTFDRLQDTIDAVNCLDEQKYSEKEIVVVVDRNRDLYLRLLEKLPRETHVYLSTDAGASSARNLGVNKSSGEIIAFIDDDIIVDKSWLPKLLKHYQDPNVISVGGKIEPLWTNDSQRNFPQELYWIIGCTFGKESDRVCEVRNNFAGNMSFRRNVFKNLSFATSCQKIDGQNLDKENNTFLRSYLETDDTEFYIRVHESFPNFKTLYDPSALAYHRIYLYRTSLGFVLHKALSEGVSKAYIARFYSAKTAGVTLSKEQDYIYSLFSDWLPTRLKKILLNEDLSKDLKSTFLILTSSIAVFFGFFIGSMVYRRRSKPKKVLQW
jgi:glucosyl-dolichyl phosphate glucuronosyltransferase